MVGVRRPSAPTGCRVLQNFREDPRITPEGELALKRNLPWSTLSAPSNGEESSSRKIDRQARDRLVNAIRPYINEVLTGLTHEFG